MFLKIIVDNCFSNSSLKSLKRSKFSRVFFILRSVSRRRTRLRMPPVGGLCDPAVPLLRYGKYPQ